VFEKRLAIGAVSERNIEHLRVFDGLLHAIANAERRLFGLDDCKRQVVGKAQQIIGFFLRPAFGMLSLDVHTSVRKRILHANLRLFIPAGAFDGRRNQLQLHIFFGELMIDLELWHQDNPLRLQYHSISIAIDMAQMKWSLIQAVYDYHSNNAN